MTAKNVIRAVFFKSVKNDEPRESTGAGYQEVGDDSMDGLEALIGSFVRPSSQEMSETEPLKKLDSQLSAYENLKSPFITAKTDPTAFWMEHAANDHDLLFALASVALDIICVPVTEVTAERLFSFLNYIFSKLRSCLKSDILEDILFCRWNQKLLKTL